MNDMESKVWGETHKGWIRRQNQDRFLVKEINRGIILAVADGMGGHIGGEIAAEKVIEAVKRFDFTLENLEKELILALGEGEKKIQEIVKENSDLEDMGTTLTLAAVTDHSVYWLHVGDSRLYRFSGQTLAQVTTDHTFIQDLIDDGILTLEQARKHPLKNMLDQCVGMDGIQPDSGKFCVEGNDCLLLCSDGLTRHLSHEEIEFCLEKGISRSQGAKTIVKELMAMALNKGGEDNITVVLILMGRGLPSRQGSSAKAEGWLCCPGK